MIKNILANATAGSTWNGWILLPQDVNNLVTNYDRQKAYAGNRSYFKPGELAPDAGDNFGLSVPRPDNISVKSWLRLA